MITPTPLSTTVVMLIYNSPDLYNIYNILSLIYLWVLKVFMTY